MDSSASPQVIVIVGPTAVGKTSLGIDLARRLGGQIISADSRQIYRHLDIGTAKPTAAEQSEAPHHLIDMVEPGERYSAGAFGRAARELVAQLQEREVTPIVVGGSGFYVSALVDGLFEVDDPARHREVWRELESRLRSEGPMPLFEELGAIDPLTQSSLSPNDFRRLLRALVLARSAEGARNLVSGGHSPLEQAPLMFCVHRDRQDLYRRVDERVLGMIEAGWRREVADLLKRGWDRNCAALESLGYGEMVQHLEDGLPLPDAVGAIQQRSRRYAKRQLTWFRRDRRLRWLDVGRLGSAGVIERILAHCQRFEASSGGSACVR
ncbi:tRNA (adenosine(37)-N6)-dimethylallyltransferase MiaA [Candidatus Latescibacterota bacterium]